MQPRKARIVWTLGIVIPTVGCDQLSKQLAIATLKGTGRHSKPIDLRDVERLAFLDLAPWAISRRIGLHPNTFLARMKEFPVLADCIEAGRARRVEDVNRRFLQTTAKTIPGSIYETKNISGWADDRGMNMPVAANIRIVIRRSTSYLDYPDAPDGGPVKIINVTPDPALPEPVPEPGPPAELEQNGPTLD